LKREVYTKDLKGQTMVRKFLLWKTNKETASDEFPAYVVHYTDFSPNRKDALAREIRVSSSREQIESLFAGLKAENIKAGWQQISVAESAVQNASGDTAVAPAKVAAGEPATRKAKPKKSAAPQESPPPNPEGQGTDASDSGSSMAPSERKQRNTKKKSG
jgi:hypothetical protein